MPYVGRDLQRGNYLKLDDISSSFNGSLTTFNLTSGGNAFFPGSAFSIIVSLGGVVQEPESAFQIDRSQIIFATAPTSSSDFFCIALGVALGVGVPGHNTVGNNQLAKPLSYGDYFRWDSANNRVGINTLLPSTALDVVGSAAFSGNVSIGGTLTYEDVANIDAVGIITARAGIEDKTLTTGRVVYAGAAGRLVDNANLTFDGNDVGIARSIFHLGDTDTSIGFDAADNIEFITGGNERLRIAADGKLTHTAVGEAADFGTTSGSGAYHKYDLSASGATTGYIGAASQLVTGAVVADFGFRSQANMVFSTGGATERIRIRASDGHIGINTVTPTKLVTIKADAPFVRLEAQDGSDKRLDFEVTNTGIATISATQSSQQLSFKTTDGEAMRIASNGKVAIGTDAYGNVAPLAPLHVSSYSPTTAVTDHDTLRGASQLVLQTSNNVNNSRSGLMFSGALHSTDGCSAGIIANHENVTENSESTSLSFFTSHSETLGERFRIASAGQIGLSGANYGTSGQFLKSTGNSSAPVWDDVPAGITINNNAANRVITGEGGTTLNGEARLTYDGAELTNDNITSNNDSAVNIYKNTGDNADKAILRIGYGETNSFKVWRPRADANIYVETSQDNSDISIRTNSSGTIAQRVLIQHDGRVSINENTYHSQGQFTVKNTNDFSTASVTTNTDNIFLISDATSGDGVYGASIGFSRVQYPDRRAAAIATVQRGSDEDNVGLAFFTHPNANATDPVVEALRIDSSGSVNIGGDYAQTTYKLKVTGSFAATTKSFVIDHPTKENHSLRYACLEGPENSVYVRGKTSDSVIELPDYWTGLVHDDSITVNVTPIGNHKVWVESINNNSVTIGSNGSEYFYTIFAERKDVDKLEVEVAD